MQLDQYLYDHFRERASITKVTRLCIGLRYTAVTTDTGGMGIAFTYQGSDSCCATKGSYQDFEGRAAIELLGRIKAHMPLHRSMALALINALNYAEARALPEDATDRGWLDSFAIEEGTRVAMVGFFRPLMKKFKERGALVEVLDDGQGIGDRTGFYRKLDGWADVLLLTSTSIINETTEELLGRLGPAVKVVMLGPSTPMAPAAFRHLPVHMLAGTVPDDQAAVMKAVRHGEGTPVIHRFSRKVFALLAGD
ncbi:MAG: DUF364 domain-containing protein [Desulfatitalea sp.]